MQRNRTLEYLMKKFPEIVKIDNDVNEDEQLFKKTTFETWCKFLKHSGDGTDLSKDKLEDCMGKILQYTKFIENFYSVIPMLKPIFIKKYVSKNKYISPAFVQSNIKLNWDWNLLASHKNMDIEFIEKHRLKLLKYHQEALAENPNLTIEFIYMHDHLFDDVDGMIFLEYIDTSKNNIDVIIDYYKKYHVDDEKDIYNYLFFNKTLKCHDIEKLFKKIDGQDIADSIKICLSMNKNITVDLIEKYPHNFHLKALGGNSFKYQNKIFDEKIKERTQLYYYLNKKICYDLSRHITTNY